MSETYLTKVGLKKLQDEYKTLQKRKLELQQEVNKAAALGDLRENGEYHAAKEHLMHVGTRLTELEIKLSNVRIIDDLDVAAGEARMGTRVTLIDIQIKEEVTYILVGPEEADPQQGRISIASPLGKSVLGKKAGDEFTLELPKAKVPYKVKKVDRPT
ncbi:MAG: transcription elongation factor GreA [Candidatus Omnitrophica bacterium]|nr:transcription elongation factor GreA [Candidatus Omnitrophota bacterium]